MASRTAGARRPSLVALEVGDQWLQLACLLMLEMSTFTLRALHCKQPPRDLVCARRTGDSCVSCVSSIVCGQACAISARADPRKDGYRILGGIAACTCIREYEFEVRFRILLTYEHWQKINAAFGSRFVSHSADRAHTKASTCTVFELSTTETIIFH